MPDRSAGQTVAVFGSSACPQGTEEYRQALEVGRLLAAAGCKVINGGYGGVMEASARGAREAGGRTIGVTTGAFRQRGGANTFIERELREPDLFLRTRRLVESASAFIILPGGVGTLAELAFVWALEKAGLLGPKPILLLGRVWESLLPELLRLGLAEERDLASSRLVRDPREAVEAATRVPGRDPLSPSG